MENKDIYFDYIFEIIDEFTFYNFYFYSTKGSEIIMISFNFTKEFNGEIIIKSNNENKVEKIENKITGKIYFELTREISYKLNFRNLNYDNNKGKFQLKKITGLDNNNKVDINQDIIEFDKIESSKETSPLTFIFDSIRNNHFKKFYIESDNITNIISIKKYFGNYKPLINNYYYFERSYSYTIKINSIKFDNYYIFNQVKLTEFSANNIEKLNTSKNIIFNETNVDKFILLDFTGYSKIIITLINGSSTLQYAKPSLFQYLNFPRDVQNINFEKIQNNSIEIKKKNSNYMILLAHLNQDLTNIEINFKNEKNTDNDSTGGHKDGNDGLSTLNIVLISASGVVFLAIVVILFIVIKKKKAKNKENKVLLGKGGEFVCFIVKVQPLP